MQVEGLQYTLLLLTFLIKRWKSADSVCRYDADGVRVSHLDICLHTMMLLLTLVVITPAPK